MKISFYENEYLENIKLLIKKEIFSYKWVDINNTVFWSPRLEDKNTQKFYKHNPYFQRKEWSKELVNDILKNGTYSPITGILLYVDEKGRDIIQVGSGLHRVKSLKKYNKNINRKFLFILFNKEKNLPIKLSTNLKEKTKICYTHEECRNVLDQIISMLNKDFIKYNIKPLEVLNNEELFEKWIKEED